MYTRYAESKRWKVEVMSSNETDIGGFKEIVFMITGFGAYRLKYESGVHRVQECQTQRLGKNSHFCNYSSCSTRSEEVDIEINQNDLRMMLTDPQSWWPTLITDSAIRITHYLQA